MNFGPPDWLPWGTYVANKYRREGRSATLSHDALLIALVTAAPDVQRRLQREAKVGTPPDCHLVGSCCQTNKALAETASVHELSSAGSSFKNIILCSRNSLCGS